MPTVYKQKSFKDIENRSFRGATDDEKNQVRIITQTFIDLFKHRFLS